jgi:hypothetical protein
MEHRKASPRGSLPYDGGSESSLLIKALCTKEVEIDRIGSSVKGMNLLSEHPRCCTQSYRVPQLNLVDNHEKQLNGEVLKGSHKSRQPYIPVGIGDSYVH